MRLFSYIDWADDECIGLLGNDRVVPIGHRWEFPPERVPEWAERFAALAGAQGLKRSTLRPTAAVTDPGKIVCVGLNYRDHAAEGGRLPPDRPLLFAKFANAIVADGEPVVRPEGTHALDLEVELGLVIGSPARRVAVADALQHVAGYVVVNDISARDWQGVPPMHAPGVAVGRTHHITHEMRRSMPQP
jgi:2-keto-4-pentenoate hydratase/2-oxohepta-3-ene-1,7-dioic acid hydratase in catechol pathway